MKVVVAMSGGVDSSVTAGLLVEQGLGSIADLVGTIRDGREVRQAEAQPAGS